MKKFLVAAILFSVQFIISAQNMQDYSTYSLFSDLKANKVGDAITILVVESSQAFNNAEKTTGKSSDLGLNLAGTVGSSSVPGIDAGIKSNNNFKGSGSTKTSGMISTKISTTIDSVLQNGNLHIRGSRKLIINGEEQTIQIKGIVRPSDIMTDNTVLSYNISEAEIVIQGKGMIEDSQSPGWLTKFFHWIF